MRPTQLGEGYRGRDGPIGYLLRQTIHPFNMAMDTGLQRFGLTSAQFGALFVLANEPGLSAADVARAMGTTPQAANLLVAGMEREHLVRRTPHPTHGRILEIFPTDEGTRRFRASRPFIRRLEEAMSAGLTEAEVGIVKRWLVDAARAAAASTTRSRSTG